MIIFLASWAVMFVSLFFAYGMVRARSHSWPPEDLPQLPTLLPAINTGVLVASSVALQAGLAAARAARAHLVGPLLAASLLLGALFLGLQVDMWRDLYHAGLRPHTGTYASVFYGLTGVHALHVAVGLVALAALTVRAWRGAYTPARHITLKMWVMYWHFVGVVWLVMFGTIYLL
jgi:cytochrome c oxidase subunit 3